MSDSKELSYTVKCGLYNLALGMRTERHGVTQSQIPTGQHTKPMLAVPDLLIHAVSLGLDKGVDDCQRHSCSRCRHRMTSIGTRALKVITLLMHNRIEPKEKLHANVATYVVYESNNSARFMAREAVRRAGSSARSAVYGRYDTVLCALCPSYTRCTAARVSAHTFRLAGLPKIMVDAAPPLKPYFMCVSLGPIADLWDRRLTLARAVT
ncbi:hypothetical protein CBL_05300 [Carabus blaptoides fortunei]